MVWFLMAVPVGFGLMMLRLLQSLYRDIVDFRGGKHVYEGEKMFD
jgi:TRAP-type C4-dicarboxylate transport system permease small subunit